MDVQKLNSLHDAAMEYAGLALFARQQRKYDEAQALFQQAFDLELEVASELEHSTLEPSRSVVHRSAATLALDCGRYQDASRLILTALEGNPPPEIEAELRELWNQVYDARREKSAGD